MATTFRSVNLVLLRLKFTCFLSVLPPVLHVECCLQMSLRFSPRKMCFPTLSLLHWIELNWLKYFSWDTLNYLKVLHCACLDRRVCFCPEIHPFNITSPFDTFSVCTVLFVCIVCVSFFFIVGLCVANDLFRPWPTFIGCLLINNNLKLNWTGKVSPWEPLLLMISIDRVISSTCS